MQMFNQIVLSVLSAVGAAGIFVSPVAPEVNAETPTVDITAVYDASSDLLVNVNDSSDQFAIDASQVDDSSYMNVIDSLEDGDIITVSFDARYDEKVTKVERN